MPVRCFSIRAAIHYGFSTVLNNIGFFLGLMCIVVGAGIALNAIGFLLNSFLLSRNFTSLPTPQPTVLTAFSKLSLLASPHDVNLSLIIVIQFLMAALGVFLYQTLLMAWARAGLQLYDHKAVHLSEIWPSLGLLVRGYCASLLATFLIILGMTLIIPGFIALAMFLLSLWVIVDTNLSPWQALKESARITRGCRMKLLLFYFVDILVTFSGLLAFGIGIFITIPVAVMAKTYVYRQLKPAMPNSHSYFEDID